MLRTFSKSLLIAAALILLGISAAVAHAASTRAEYVAQADPICQVEIAQEQASLKAYVRTLKRHLKNHPNADRNRPSKKVARVVIRFYSRIVTIERAANSRLAAIGPSPGDDTAISTWLGLRVRSSDLLDRAVSALRHRRLKLFAQLYLKSIRRNLQAVIPITDFGFQYCSLPEPA